MNSEARVVRHEESVEAFANTLTGHRHRRARTVDVTAFIEKFMSSFIVTEDDDWLESVLELEDWTVLLRPFVVDSFCIAGGCLMKVANYWERTRSW